MEKVFISYRRDDSADITDRIYDHLAEKFGKDTIFMDVADIPLGVDFRTHLQHVIEQCAVQLVIIGPSWVGIKEPSGSLRLDNPADFVRIEVETGLARGIPVIPLLVRGALMPSADHLPQPLAPLAFRNGISVRRNPDFYNDIERLISALEPILNPSPTKKSTADKLPRVRPAEAVGETTMKSRRTQVMPPALPNKIKTDQAWLYETTEHALEILAGTPRADEHGIAQVWVAPGCFEMGSNPDADFDSQPEETPHHEVCLSAGYWMDVYPVTNGAYQAFIKDGGYKRRDLWTNEGWLWREHALISGADDYPGFTALDQPRVGICWFEADAYARWRGGRLPTEAEWEYAARGPESHLYPWGNVYRVGTTGVSEAQLGGNLMPTTLKVGSFPGDKSWAGLCDMAGNVMEWCFDWYSQNYYAQLVRDNPIGPNNGVLRAVRGGSWDGNEVNTRAAVRRAYRPSFRVNYLGVRIVSP